MNYMKSLKIPQAQDSVVRGTENWKKRLVTSLTNVKGYRSSSVLLPLMKCAVFVQDQLPRWE